MDANHPGPRTLLKYTLSLNQQEIHWPLQPLSKLIEYNPADVTLYAQILTRSYQQPLCVYFWWVEYSGESRSEYKECYHHQEQAVCETRQDLYSVKPANISLIHNRKSAKYAPWPPPSSGY